MDHWLHLEFYFSHVLFARQEVCKNSAQLKSASGAREQFLTLVESTALDSTPEDITKSHNQAKITKPLNNYCADFVAVKVNTCHNWSA